ncbi:MAG: GTP pyrophosphokinase family protein [Clostridia bacterium]|nr:GTP pyrophosphokinase family protein [Clostridia bacterium]
MKPKKKKVNELIKVENFMDYQKTLDVKDKTFEKLMFIYSVAIKELETKINILKAEATLFYDYELIDHINVRIKSPESIIKKMQKRNMELTYKDMIENINDIAGIRIVCPLKKDIVTIKEFLKKLPGVNVLKEKDYITNPKKSGYSSYHLILEVPIMLAKQNIYVKVEVQIRTIAMDFWASLEHKAKYKSDEEISKKESKEWINCAKMINKLDNKMMLLN